MTKIVKIIIALGALLITVGEHLHPIIQSINSFLKSFNDEQTTTTNKQPDDVPKTTNDSTGLPPHDTWLSTDIDERGKIHGIFDSDDSQIKRV